MKMSGIIRYSDSSNDSDDMVLAVMLIVMYMVVPGAAGGCNEYVGRTGGGCDKYVGDRW